MINSSVCRLKIFKLLVTTWFHPPIQYTANTHLVNLQRYINETGTCRILMPVNRFYLKNSNMLHAKQYNAQFTDIVTCVIPFQFRDRTEME